MTRILTPELHDYLFTAAVVGGAGSVAIASHVHVRWLDRAAWSAVAAHGTVLMLIAIAGMAVIWPHAPVRDDIPRQLAGVIVALPAGLAVALADRRIARRLTRSRGTRLDAAPLPALAGRPSAASTSRIRPSGQARELTRGLGARRSPPTWTPTSRDASVPTHLAWLLVAAVAEECVFRGVLTPAALRAPWLAGQLAGVLVVMALFCLSHLYFGWAQVVAKVPLSVAATLLCLLTGVAAAVVLHAVLNTRVWLTAKQAAG
jgi:hypothetical protein